MSDHGVSISRAEPSDYEALMELLLRCYRVHQPDHLPFSTLLPDIYQPDARLRDNITAWVDGVPVACVRLTSTKAWTGETPPCDVGVIGGVCTAPEHRGQGLMQLLMDKAIEEAYADGIPLGYLGGDRRRYQPWGFEHIPAVYEYELSPRGPDIASIEPDQWIITSVPMNQVNWADVEQELRQTDLFCYIADYALKEKYERFLMGNKKVVHARRGNQSGHILVNEGSEAVHVLAGDMEAACAAIASVLSSQKRSIKIQMPLHPHIIAQRLDGIRNHIWIQGKSMSIISLTALLEHYTSFMSGQVQRYGLHGTIQLNMQGYRGVPDQSIILQADGHQMNVSNASDRTVTCAAFTALELVDLFFNPNAGRRYASRIPDNLHWLFQLAPLPFYLPTLHQS